MKIQEFKQPKVSLSWIIEDNTTGSSKTLEQEKTKLELANTILMLLEQGDEIRIGTDGYCLILEANFADDKFTDASYQFVDDNHFVGELTENYCYPDYYGDDYKEEFENIVLNLFELCDKYQLSKEFENELKEILSNRRLLTWSIDEEDSNDESKGE